jgi:hypothetical protein
MTGLGCHLLDAGGTVTAYRPLVGAGSTGPSNLYSDCPPRAERVTVPRSLSFSSAPRPT